MDVKQALRACGDMKTVSSRLRVLQDLGLGYLTLGEATPSLSGGEAQRLKLASEMGRQQDASVFVFDEPTIGLHPLDVQTLLRVFDRLVNSGATVIVIEHRIDHASGKGITAVFVVLGALGVHGLFLSKRTCSESSASK